jgi:aspartate racemase
MKNANVTRPKIGIITGSGPEAGMDLWKKILDARRAIEDVPYGGDLDAPNVTIFSEPALGLSMELEKNDCVVWDNLRRSAQYIAGHVDYYAIACNTLNYYQGHLDALNLPARLISFSDTVLAYLREHRVERIALLGARPVTDLGPWSHYRQLVGHVDIELPNPDAALRLHQLIYDIKAIGPDAPSIREGFRAVLDELEAETVLLACTELPLIQLDPQTLAETGKALVDVTDLVATRLAQLACQSTVADIALPRVSRVTVT